MTLEKNNNENLIICQDCRGFGFTEKGRCENCQGLAMGFFRDGNFYFWGRKINNFYIFERRMHKWIDFALNACLFILGLAGLLSLFYYAWQESFLRIFKYSFWTEANLLLLFFWISLFFDMLLFYRLERSLEKSSVIKLKSYKEREEEKKAEGNDLSWRQIISLPKNKKIDISKKFSEESLQAIERAYKLARKYGHRQTDLIHLFYALLLKDKVTMIFVKLGADFDKLKQMIGRALQRQEKAKESYLSIDLKKILLKSYLEAYFSKQPKVKPADIMLVLAREENIASEILYDQDIDYEKINNVIAWIRINERMRRNLVKFKKAARLKPGSTMNRSMTALATPFLDKFSEDLTWLAKAGYIPPCVDREREMKEIMRVIESGKESVILTGKRGVGKDAIIEGVAWRMVEEDVPKILKDKRLVSLSIPELISGASPAEAEERLLRCLWEIERAGNVILVIPKIQDMVGITAGTEESLDLSEVLVDSINDRRIIVLATSLEDDYSKYIENKAIGGALKKIKVEEMDKNNTIQVLQVKSAAIQNKNNVHFSYGALEKAVDLADRYLHNAFLPAKAIDLIQEAAVEVKNKKGSGADVEAEDIASLVAEKTNIPLTNISEEESKKLLNLEEILHQRIIGQDEAVRQVSAALRRARTELREAERPIASFLFLGPTGVGKTELAKAVAENYFGSEESMIRLDMSEYQEQSGVYRLIGSPDGKSSGYLTEAVRKNPFSLLLLDELEKAHSDILDLFLQVMDDGRLTDSAGRTIDFTNIILIATSNAGTQYIQDEVRKDTDISSIKEALINKELREYYRPEFLNRFDGIIVFRPLTKEEIIKIARLMLNKVAKRLEEKGISFRATDEAVRELAERGFDPVFGARPMRRTIQEMVDNALAEYLLQGKLVRRDVAVLEPNGIIKIEKAKEL